MSNTKKEQAQKINDIQGRVQDVYFDLEEFVENDTANAAQKKAIELMDAISDIRKRILQTGKSDNS